MRILRDTDIQRILTPDLAREAMREAAVAAWRGELIAPPRVSADLDGSRLTFTCGARPGHWFGYRSYIAPGDAHQDQVVVVQDEASGAVLGMAVGEALGPCRVGAIGAAALDALGPQAPERIALVGAGTQAWHQLWALPDRFRGTPIHVHSRTTRTAFAERARTELGLDVRPAETVEAAVRDADVVILATSARQPVLAADLVRPGAYVTTLGPKQVGRSEFDPSLARDAAMVVSDSPQQVQAYDPPNVLVGSAIENDIVHVGAVLAGERPVPEGTTVFFSVGLAGTEAWLLHALLTSGVGQEG